MNTNSLKPDPMAEDELREKLAEYIYEATRVEAEWSKRPIVPELWRNRDDKFRNQFVDIIAKYMSMDKLPSPAEAHESWNQSYYKMGWKYGEVRDVEVKTHPDLVPFDELPQPEKDKDAIFLAFVWLATQLNELTEAYTTNKIIEARIDQMNSWFIEADDGGVILRAYLPPTEKRMRLEGQFVTAYYYTMELLKEALNHRKDLGQ